VHVQVTDHTEEEQKSDTKFSAEIAQADETSTHRRVVSQQTDARYVSALGGGFGAIPPLTGSAWQSLQDVCTSMHFPLQAQLTFTSVVL